MISEFKYRTGPLIFQKQNQMILNNKADQLKIHYKIYYTQRDLLMP